MHVIFVQVQSDRRVNCERNNRIKRHTNLGGMYTNVVPACKGDDEQKQFDWPDSIAIGYVHARVHEGQWSSRVRISGEVKNSNNQKKTEFAIVDQLSRDCVAHVMQLSQHQRLWTLNFINEVRHLYYFMLLDAAPPKIPERRALPICLPFLDVWIL